MKSRNKIKESGKLQESIKLNCHKTIKNVFYVFQIVLCLFFLTANHFCISHFYPISISIAFNNILNSSCIYFHLFCFFIFLLYCYQLFLLTYLTLAIFIFTFCLFLIFNNSNLECRNLCR